MTEPRRRRVRGDHADPIAAVVLPGAPDGRITAAEQDGPPARQIVRHREVELRSWGVRGLALVPVRAVELPGVLEDGAAHVDAAEQHHAIALQVVGDCMTRPRWWRAYGRDP